METTARHVTRRWRAMRRNTSPWLADHANVFIAFTYKMRLILLVGILLAVLVACGGSEEMPEFPIDSVDFDDFWPLQRDTG